jgi:hypothetical protein
MAAKIKAAIKPNIGSILALLEIVIDEKESNDIRLDAADTLLSYEAPEEAVQAAKDYLTSVFNDKKLTSLMRLQAIKLMRKSEARRILSPSAPPSPDLARRLESANKRLAESRAREEAEEQSKVSSD